ncbi:60S ribosomal protein L4 [Papilio machaon]|uniref:60S ribosomal protein L4 n=1 Tax=Papilio machaon TaxID=76193 RepID=A0A0N1IQ89_PAPMA|nr:60S ribosomal protein L4 [Papilio machaon]
MKDGEGIKVPNSLGLRLKSICLKTNEYDGGALVSESGVDKAADFASALSAFCHIIDKIPELPLVVSDKVQEINKTKQAVIFLRRIKAWSDNSKIFIPELPLVVSDKVQEINKTKQAVIFLRRIKAWSDVLKVYKSQRLRAGKGKMRNRRRLQRKGPLIVYHKDQGLTRAFRNIPGVDMLKVDKLNLLKLAPGGHVGRFIIWTKSAFERLDPLFGSWKTPSKEKKNFNLPQPKMANTDLTRLLKSEEIRKVLRAPNKRVIRATRKLNPLTNTKAMLRLNPYSAVLRRKAVLDQQRKSNARALALAEKRGIKLPSSDPAVKAEKLRERRQKLLKLAAAKKTKKPAAKKTPPPPKKVKKEKAPAKK